MNATEFRQFHREGIALVHIVRDEENDRDYAGLWEQFSEQFNVSGLNLQFGPRRGSANPDLSLLDNFALFLNR